MFRDNIHLIVLSFFATVWSSGLCEGEVTFFDGEHYTVNYPSVKIEGEVVDTKMLDDSTLTTNWNTHLLHPGQHVWAFIGKGKHPAIIKSIDLPEETAIVKWTESNWTGSVELRVLFPMFDSDESGENQPSRFSRRKKMRPNYFVDGNDKPLVLKMKSCKEEPKDSVNLSNSIKIKSNYETKQAPTRKQCGKTRKPGRKKEYRKVMHKRKKTINPDDEQSMKRQYSEGEVPGPGWKIDGSFWLSPDLGLSFTPFEACKLEAFRIELGGNEAEAYRKYQKFFGAPNSGKSTKDDNKEDETQLPPELEKEYAMLWNFYLDPKVRKNEELPNGMIIRKRVAQCSLLRAKCKFRWSVYRKILALNQENKKHAIYRILKQLHDHDVHSGSNSAGPGSLMEEILGKSSNPTDDEIEFLQSSTVKSPTNTLNTINVEEVSDNNTSMSSLTESLPRASFDATEPQEQNAGIRNFALLSDHTDFEENVKLVDLLGVDTTVARHPTLEPIDVDSESNIYNMPTPKKLYDTKIIDLLKEDGNDDPYHVPTPKRRQLVIDLVEEEEDCKPSAYRGNEVSINIQTRTPSTNGIIDLTEDESSGKLYASAAIGCSVDDVYVK